MNPGKEGTEGEDQPYVDLFLIHAPTCGPEGRQLLWDAFIEVSRALNPVRLGLVRSSGSS